MAPAARRLTETREPSPFLKWVGGKRQLLSRILAALPKGKFRRYAEPFVGGAAVFFELVRLDRVHDAILCDTNEDLVLTYVAVRDKVDAVIDVLQEHTNDPDHYYAVRALDPAKLTLPQRAARTIFMNRCGYNGLYRVNAKGKYNVPFGRYSNPTICDVEGLRAASAALQHADIQLCDFGKVRGQLKKGDVAYFDPPYVPLSATSSFTGYTRNGFDVEDQTRLRDLALALKKKGVHVVLSNSSAPLVYDLYREGFDCREVAATRMINCQGDGRGRICELLIR
jgi:DNA adenine methylase